MFLLFFDRVKSKYNDEDDDGASSDDGWNDIDTNEAGGLGPLDDDDESDLDTSSEEDSDDEDEEALLQAELAKIRAEREAAKKKAEEEVSIVCESMD